CRGRGLRHWRLWPVKLRPDAPVPPMSKAAHPQKRTKATRQESAGAAAGFLVAAMVWLLPGAEGAQFPVITLMTYLIAAGGFMHILAGSVGAFFLVVHRGMTSWGVGSGVFAPRVDRDIIGGNHRGGTLV